MITTPFLSTRQRADHRNSSFLISHYANFFKKETSHSHKEVAMKLISWNVNGLRACLKKGFAEAFATLDAEIGRASCRERV